MSKPASPLVTDISAALATLRTFYDQVGNDPEVAVNLGQDAGSIDVGGITLTAERWRELKSALNLLEDGPNTWQPSQLKPTLFARDGSPMFASEHYDNDGYWTSVGGITVTCIWAPGCRSFYNDLLKEVTQLLEDGTHYYRLHNTITGYLFPGFAATTNKGGAVTTLDQLRAMKRDLENVDDF